ncbi:MAG: hypothetical protein V3U79_11495 [Dehalococcoidia bacterium]
MTAAEILALSREQIEQVKNLRMEVSGKFQQGDVTYPFKMDGEMELPDTVHGTVEILGEQQEFLSIGEEDFTAEPGRSFERNDDDEFGSFFLGLLKPVLEPGFDDPFIDPTRQRDETLEGQEFYHITFLIDMLGFIERFYGEEMEIKGIEIRARGELFIDQKSLLPHRFIVNCRSCFIPLGPGLDMVVEFSLSGFNEMETITLPPEVVRLLESRPATIPTQAQMAEWDNLQAAIDAYMADKALVAVPVRTASLPSTNDFSPTAALELTDYLRNTVTLFYYCWDDTGLVTQQDTVPATCPSAQVGKEVVVEIEEVIN